MGEDVVSWVVMWFYDRQRSNKSFFAFYDITASRVRGQTKFPTEVNVRS